MVMQHCLLYLKKLLKKKNYHKYFCKWKKRISKSGVKSESISDQSFKQKKMVILQDNMTGLHKKR